MITRALAVTSFALLLACAPSCGAEFREHRGDHHEGKNSKQGGGDKRDKNVRNPERQSDPVRASGGSGDGVVFFPAGAVDALKAKAAKFGPVRARLDSSIAHARKKLDERPDAVEEIKLEGVMRGERETGKIVGEFDTILDFALAGTLTGEQSFFDKADEFLTAWARTYKPDGNPIDEYHFTTYVMAFELARGRMPEKDRDAVSGMLLALYDAEVEFVTRGKGFEIYGNWVSHHATLCAAIAFLRKDPAQIAYVEKVFRTQLSNNIFDACQFQDFVQAHWAKRSKDVEQAPNLTVERGETFDFIHRDALSYHLESLNALFITAVIAKNNGLAWFDLKGDQGQTLWWGYDFVVPYATGEKRHWEFDKTLHEPDRKKKEKRWFSPEVGMASLTIASSIHPEYRKYRKPELLKNDEGLLLYLIETGPDEF